MRVQIADLPQHLKGQLAPFYFIWGEEPLQRNETLDAIRAQAKNQGYTEREILDLSSMAETQVEYILNMPSLFANKRLLECRLKEDKITKAFEILIQKILSCLNPDQIIIIVYPQKLEYNAFKSSWFTAIEKKGVTINAQNLTYEQWLPWIKSRSANLNLNFDQEAIYLLNEYTEGNLLACAQILEKIALVKNNRTNQFISSETLLPFLDLNTRYSIFELVDALLKGDILRTTRIFTSLNNIGTEATLILWVITKEVRTLILLCERSKNTRQPINEQLMDAFTIWKQKRIAVLSFLKRHSLHSLYEIMQYIQKIDHLIKSGCKKQIFTHLNHLCIYLSGNENKDRLSLLGEENAKF